VYRLISWIDICTDMHQENTWVQLSAQTQQMLDEVWMLAFTWVTRPKTPTDLAAFLALGCHCMPEQCIDPDHEDGVNLYQELENDATIHWHIAPRWFLLLHFLRVFELLDNQDDNPDDQKLVHISRRQLWPRSRRTLLPHGTEGTLRGLLQWFEQDLDPHILQRLHLVYKALLTFCPPLVLPRIVTSANFVSLAIIRPIYGLEQSLKTLVPSGTPSSRHGFAIVINAVVYLCGLIRNITQTIGNGGERAAFNQRAPQQLLKAYEVFLRISQFLSAYAAKYDRVLVETGALDQCVNNISARAAEVIMDCPDLNLDITPESPLYTFSLWHYRQMRQTESTRERVWDRLLRMLVSLKIEQCCASPSCRATTVDARLKACTGCMRFLYCSRTCQRRAWNHHTVPHRGVCQVVADVYKRYQLPEASLRDWAAEKDTTPPGSAWVASAKLVTVHLRTLTEMRTAAFANATKIYLAISPRRFVPSHCGRDKPLELQRLVPLNIEHERE
jgi:hypothetical protein